MAQVMAARPGASHLPESNSPSVQAQASPHTTEKLLRPLVEHVIVPPRFWYLMTHPPDSQDGRFI